MIGISNTSSTLNTPTTYHILMTMRDSKRKVSKRNIVLKIETYGRLEKFLIELMKSKESPRVSFDEAVNTLLDGHEKGGSGNE